MATENLKLNTFDVTANRPKLKDSQSTEIKFKEVEVLDLTAPVNYTAVDKKLSTHLAAIDSALGSAAGTTMTDDVFRIDNVTDPTKRIAFSAAPIQTNTTRTITMANANVDLADVNKAILNDGSRSMAADLNMGNFQLIDLGVPTQENHAATKNYVDQLLDGRKWKQSVKIATTANLTSIAGLLTIDGVTLLAGDRVLVKNQASPSANGIYVAAAGPWDRSEDADSASELVAAAVYVEQGTENADKQYAQTSDNITLGSTAIVWALTSANHFSGHDMIVFNGGQISVDLATAGGLSSTSPGNSGGQLQINVDNSSVSISGSNALEVKDAGITSAKLNSAIAGDMISGGAGSALSIDLDTNAGLVSTNPGNVAGKLQVNTDNSTLERASNVLQVKDLGITSSKLAANAVTKDKLNANVVGAGLKIAATGEIEDDDVVSLQNDDVAGFSAGEFGIIEADGNVVKLQANYAGTINVGSSFVVAMASVASGASGKFAVGSVVASGYSGLSEEQPVYASRTTKGSYIQSLSGFASGEHIILLGKAISASEIKFQPEYVAEF
jgi:hypothetical protein